MRTQPAKLGRNRWHRLHVDSRCVGVIYNIYVNINIHIPVIVDYYLSMCTYIYIYIYVCVLMIDMICPVFTWCNLTRLVCIHVVLQMFEKFCNTRRRSETHHLNHLGRIGATETHRTHHGFVSDSGKHWKHWFCITKMTNMSRCHRCFEDLYGFIMFYSNLPRMM